MIKLAQAEEVTAELGAAAVPGDLAGVVDKLTLNQCPVALVSRDNLLAFVGARG